MQRLNRAAHRNTRKAALTLIHLLVVLSLLLPNLGVTAAPGRANPEKSEAASRVSSEDEQETPAAKPTPTAPSAAEPSQAEEPSPSPTPTPTPSPNDPPDPGSYRLEIELLTPAASPGESVAIAWQVSGWTEASQELTLRLELPSHTALAGAEREPESRVQSASGTSLVQIEDGAIGPYDIQVILLWEGKELQRQSVQVAESGKSQVGEAGGTASGLGERVKVNIPAGAVAETLTLHIRRPAPASQPLHSLSGQPFEVHAVGQDSGSEQHQFAQPLTIHYTYDPEEIQGDERYLRMYRYDPEQNSWLPLPSRVDIISHTVSAETTHLSVFDVTLEGWEAARLPGLQEFQVAQFAGAASAGYSLWAPPGPGGLQPTLELSYNSQAVENAIAGQTQASWVGMGWSLETGAVERNQNGTPNYTGDDTYSIQAGGISSLLLPGGDGYYHTSSESYWRIQYDAQSDSWIAWDKSGVKYSFGDSAGTRAQYPSGYHYNCQSQNYTSDPTTWRWSLHKVRNVYGQELEYSYTTDTQLKTHPCDENLSFNTAIAVYPAGISYPGGSYQVAFDLEGRTDYKSEWTQTDTLNFYQRYRLDKIRVLKQGATIRSYDLSYASSGVIYPTVSWSAGGATLTLSGLQETGVDGINRLPQQSFSYDALHLVESANGYGGRVENGYESTPWHDVATTTAKTLAETECVLQQGSWKPLNMTGYNGGAAWCQVNSQGKPLLYISGSAYMNVPLGLYQPGAVYRAGYQMYNEGSQSLDVAVGLHDGNGVILAQTATGLGSGGYYEIRGVAVLPAASASSLRVHLSCSGVCRVEAPELELLPTRYRVVAQRQYDGLEANPQEYSYTYDGAASNDCAHSAAACSENPYTAATSEGRGHAMVEQSAPDGRVSSSYYQQDDILKGQPSAELTMSASLTDDFESDTPNPNTWSGLDGGAPETERVEGDKALKVVGDTAWRGVERTSASLEDGEVALLQFRLENSANGVVTIESGVYVQPGYQRLGVFAHPDGSLKAQKNDGSGFINAKTLIPSGQYQREAWTVLLLAVDAQQFHLRAWQRDNPAKAGSYEVSLNSGGGWRLRAWAQNGGLWLDGYREGRLYTLSLNQYEVRDDIPLGTLPAPAGGGDAYSGLDITWSGLDIQESYTYEGDGEWIGRRSEQKYDSYGNPVREVESAWAPQSSTWQDLRVQARGYYPNVSAGTYLVGLAGWQNSYACPAGYSNGSCSENYAYPNNPPSAWAQSSITYLYDNHTSGQQPPSQGILSGQRSFLYWASPPSSDARFRDESYAYDAWGNLTEQRVYTGEGSEAQYGVGNPQVTSSSYDATFHTYRISESNALGQATTWSYDSNCGLPVSETGPNGAASSISASYDNYCRLEQVVRPGDSSSYPSLSVEYHDEAQPYWIEVRQRIEAGSGLERIHREIYDGLGRIVQAQSGATVLADNACSQDSDSAEDVCDIKADTTFDGNGRVIRQSMPYAAAAWNGVGNPWNGRDLSQPATQTNYELLGRVQSVLAPDGSQNSLTYRDGGASAPGGYAYQESCQTDAAGRTTCTRQDVFGRIRQVQPAQGPLAAYEYDVKDQLVAVQTGGSVTSLEYDKAGRKTRMSDPDMGVWKYTYDALHLTRQTDARGQRICLYYDSLERLAGKHYRTDDACPSVNPSLNVSYTYDAYDPGNGQYGKGMRTGMTDSSGSASWNYDVRGRQVGELRVVSGVGSFRTGWSYNSADLLQSMTYPGGSAGQAGEVVSYQYHPQGALKSMLSNTNSYYYLQAAQYDAAGRLELKNIGAPNLASQPVLKMDYEYFAWSTSHGQGRLKQIRAGTPGSPSSLLDLRYYSGTDTPAYDAVGNLLNIYDYKMGSPQVQSFTYDAADRLTSASASGGTGGNVGLESYSYQAETGVLSSKGGQALSYTAQVSCPDGSRTLPHAASAMGANTYSYDCSGNMTQRVIGGSTYNLAYDAENRLSTVSGAASATYVYDGDGVRVKSTVGGASTVTIGSYFEWTGSSSTMKRYYEAGGSRIGMRQGSTLYWLVSDHLGSTSVTANASGSLYGRLLYKAWGEQRWSSGTTPTTYRYTGQRSESSLGLYYYGARWYDPGLARFVQADTFIPNPDNPLDWDRYMYSRNQPVKYVDPTGHWVETVLDIGFIVYDWYQINQEGWTLVNTVALVADIACAVIPVGTGGGPAVRAAMAGGDAVLTYTRAATQLPDVIRAGQVVEKLAQGIDGQPEEPNISFSSSDSNSGGWKVGDPINAPTPNGYPSWSTVRERYWKNRANNAIPGEFSTENLARMRNGNPPFDPAIGVSMELHHINGRRIVDPHNINNLKEVWPWKHSDIDPYRHYQGPRPE